MGTRYSTNSASGYNSTPPADDGTVSEANKVKWSTVKTKLGDPVKDLADTINSELVTHFNNGPTAITSNTTLDSTHYNKVIQVSGSGVTLTLTDASTLGAGWYCDIVSTDTTNNVTLARATASNMINETSADITILALQDLHVVVNAAANGFLVSHEPRHGKKFTVDALTVNNLMTLKKGADIASATTVDLTAATGNLIHITGTTTTTALTMNSGQMVWMVADGAWPLTYHATNLKLNTNGSDYTCEAGDQLVAWYDGTSKYVTVIPFRLAATAAEINTGSEVNRYINPDKLLDAIGFTARYASGNQTITSGGSLTLAHGLGRTPVLIVYKLKCLTAENGYSIGDVVRMDQACAGGLYGSLTCVPDATNLNVRFTSVNPICNIIHYTTGAQPNITNANWAFIVEAYA